MAVRGSGCHRVGDSLSNGGCGTVGSRTMVLLGRMRVSGSVLVGEGWEETEISICDERPSIIVIVTEISEAKPSK